jgi:hypothetical protein
MKKIYTCILLTFLVGMFLSSCHTSINIKKRHYRKGYYVNINREWNNASCNEVSNEEQFVKEEKAPESFPSEINHESEKSIPAIKSKHVDDLPVPVNNHKIVLERSMYKGNYHVPAKTFAKKFVGLKQKPGHVFKKLNSIKDINDDDGYSLLWILILILLILWLLGVLSGGWGLGGLLYILLVIALILLILWLLKIL